MPEHLSEVLGPMRRLVADFEAILARWYTGREPATRGIVWRWRYLRHANSRGAYTPPSVRCDGRVCRLLWRLGFDYETCHRWRR